MLFLFKLGQVSILCGYYFKYKNDCGLKWILCKRVIILKKKMGGGALCVEMDLTQTFDANTKCNNISTFGSSDVQ